MSGGSFGYLCYKEADELFSSGPRRELASMIEALSEIPNAEDAARETAELEALLKRTLFRVEAMQKRLSPVWRAVEWWHSCDWGPDQVQEALDAYRNE